jgi:hypothetical protein
LTFSLISYNNIGADFFKIFSQENFKKYGEKKKAKKEKSNPSQDEN